MDTTDVFIIWVLFGMLFVGIGIADFFAKKAVGFWANCETIAVEDVKSYNRSVGILFCAYGIIFILLGVPMLCTDFPWILIMTPGIMLESIAAMIVYTVVIEPKYRKK